MLIHIRDLFKNYDSSFAYPAFNTQNLETTLGTIQAAEEVDAPVIIATSAGTVGYAGLETIAAIVKTVASRSKVGIVLHFDHGKDIGHLERAIELGHGLGWGAIDDPDDSRSVATELVDRTLSNQAPENCCSVLQ